MFEYDNKKLTANLLIVRYVLHELKYFMYLKITLGTRADTRDPVTS